MLNRIEPAEVWRRGAEESMGEFSRAQFLQRELKGGVALAAGGALLAVAAPVQAGENPADALPEGDLAILRLATSAELLAQDFYGQAIATRKLERDGRAYLAAARSNERAHDDALAKAMGTAPIADDFRFTYSGTAFKSAKSIAKLGLSLETAFVGLYAGVGGALERAELRVVAARIGACEATHLSVLSQLDGGDPVGPAFPTALNVEQASAALDRFLGE
jgi:Ferritin-like domain